MTGDPIDAATAAQWGLINRSVPADQLDAATLDLIQRASRGGALSKAMGKRAFYQQIGMTQGQAYEFAAGVMADATITPDAQEGFNAFLEKRHAHFVQVPERS